MCKASEMYEPSALFRAAYDYANNQYDLVAILSAKYGLLLPNDQIEPYDITIKKMPAKEKRQWSEKVIRQIDDRIGLSRIEECYFHAGREYRRDLILLLQTAGIRCKTPLEGLSIGKQLQWYKKH